jgi:DNA-binding transcriptional MerR regulator
VQDIPDKPFYKIGEVCQYTDTQPYVLRFWESEFPQLAPEKNRTGQRIYSRQDIELILRIKKLLYEEEFTIAGARRRLEQEADGEISDAAEDKHRSHPEPEAPASGEPGSGSGAAEGRAAGTSRSRSRILLDPPALITSEDEPLAEASAETMPGRLADLERRCEELERSLGIEREVAEKIRARSERVARRLADLLDGLSAKRPADSGVVEP